MSKLFSHRCRFVDYAPSAVTAFAFPHLPPGSPDPRGLRPPILAVGHANGNIDIHHWTSSSSKAKSPQAWVHLKTLAGHVGTKVDSLVMIISNLEHSDLFSLSNLRLFSSGGGSELLEWDLVSGCVLRTVGSQGGSIWSMAVSPASNHLALGCEDGIIRIFSISDGELVPSQRLDRIKSRPLSLAWGPPSRPSKPENVATGEDSDSDSEEDWQDSFLAVGCSDSSIRKIDLKTGRVVQRMTTDKARRQRTLVWTVAALSDGTIISGDSLGMVKFWDSHTCTQISSYTAHGADVLCFVIGPDGSTVYSSGVDQKIAQFSLVKGTNSSPGRWIHNCSRRWHSHDVRALATWPPYQHVPPSGSPSTPYTPLLLSGGLDMSICICPCVPPSSSSEYLPLLASQSTNSPSTFEHGYYRRMAFGQSTSPIVNIAKQARLVLCRNYNSVGIWRIADSPFANGSAEQGIEENPEWSKVAELNVKTMTNLVSSAISDDGSWVAVSDYYEAKLFCLSLAPGADSYTVRRVKGFGDSLLQHLPPNTVTAGASSLHFTSDSRKLILGLHASSALAIVDLDPQAEDQQWTHVVKVFFNHGESHHPLEFEGADGDVQMTDVSSKTPAAGSPSAVTVQRIAVSADGQWVASADDSRRIHVFNLDSIKHHCALPSFPHLITTLSFDLLSPQTLYIGLANNTFQIFDVETRLFPEWSLELCQSLPKRFTQLHDPVQGLLFSPGARDAASSISGGSKEVYAWGTSWICKLPLTASNTPDRLASFSKKRQREGGQQGAADDTTPLEVLTRYRNILMVDFLGPKELVVVERPIVDVLQTLPPAYFRHKYGT